MIDLQFPRHVLPVLLALVISTGLGIIVWRRRPGTGVVPFLVLIAGVTEWVAGSALETMAVDLSAKLVVSRLNYIGITVVPAAWLVFTLEYTGRQQWITRRNLRWLAVEPVLVQIVVWTNSLHHLFWTETGIRTLDSFVFLDVSFGALFWIHATYSYLLMLAGSVLLIRAFVDAPELYRGQITTLLVAAFVPWIANLIYLSGLNPMPEIDLTPLAFTVAVAAVGWSMYRFQLLDIVPIARGLVIESINDAVIVLDAHDRVIDINPAALDLIGGVSASQVIGQPARGIFTPFYADAVAEFGDIDTAQTEITLPGDDGVRHFELRITPLYVRSQQLTGRVFVLHEITRRRQAAEQIEAQNRALVKTNEALDRARVQAEEASRLKSEFLATISHELRTPLNSVIGYSDLLLTGLAGELNEKQRDYVQRSLSNGERLLNLINELLDLSKIEAGRLDLVPRPFEVVVLLEDTQSRMETLAQQKALAFNTRLDPALPHRLVGDIIRLEQIIVNLVSNAIKYTETGWVELRLDRPSVSTWAIVVIDTGIGIPPHAIEYIFDEFRQVDGTTHRLYQGTGLGLSIVRKLAQLMGGTVQIQSEVNRGSTFTVTLPLREPTSGTLDTTGTNHEAPSAGH